MKESYSGNIEEPGPQYGAPATGKEDMIETLIALKETRAFLTGSRRYGTVRSNSDTDVVLLADKLLMKHLRKFAVTNGYETLGRDNLNIKLQLGLEKLNLIVLHDPAEFDAWKEATELLEQRQPVTTTEAIAEIDRQKKKRGVPVTKSRFRMHPPPRRSDDPPF